MLGQLLRLANQAACGFGVAVDPVVVRREGGCLRPRGVGDRGQVGVVDVDPVP